MGATLHALAGDPISTLVFVRRGANLKKLHDDWHRITEAEVQTLNIGAGTVTVDDEGKQVKYRIEHVYLQLIKAAYARGLQGRPPWWA